MKRKVRKENLRPDDASKYRSIRNRVADELPDLITRREERVAVGDQLQRLCEQLKVAREAKGLSLAAVSEMTGMDRSAISKLESGQRGNPTMDTLVRYAEAVGKHVVVSVQ